MIAPQGQSTEICPNTRSGSTRSDSVRTLFAWTRFCVVDYSFLFLFAAKAARATGLKKRIVPGDAAGEEDVLAVTELLRRHFDTLSVTNNDVAVTREGVGNSFAGMQAFDEGGDIGVKTFWPKTADDMHTILDFPDGRPVLWNKFRATDSALTAWDEGETDATRLEYETGSERMRPEPLTLFVHQLHAIASCAETIFHEQRKTDKGGMLIADGVGLGKSATLFGVVAFLGQIREWQRTGDEAAANGEPQAGPRLPPASFFRDGECWSFRLIPSHGRVLRPYIRGGHLYSRPAPAPLAPMRS